MTQETIRGTVGPARLARRAPRWLGTASLALLGACSIDSVLEVVDPDVVTPATAADPNNISGLRLGALGDFMIAYGGNTLGGGGTEGIVLSSGLLGDELYVGDTFGTRQEVDRRTITRENAGMTTVFMNLHRARRAAESARDAYQANLTHDRYSALGHAEVTSLAGYTYLMFAENYCSGVPFSQITVDNRLEHGDPKTTAEMLTMARTAFQAAVPLAAGTSAAALTQQRLARVGEGRALLDMNQPDLAAAAVASVPTSFVYQLEHSVNTTRQNNGVWGITHNRRGYGVAHLEGGNGLPFRTGTFSNAASQDPRVPYTRNASRAIDSPYAFWWQLKYPERGSSIVLASGVEARLIEAEAALRNNDIATFVARHNTLRATMTGLAPLNLVTVTAMTQAQRVDLHFQERGFWLYLTGQRLSDMRRLVRQYGRGAETVFPTGMHGRYLYATTATPDASLTFREHTAYGTDVNFPVPFDELNNPNFVQCINRDA